jgi:2,5-furandicarboxylate decarboxylase 1
VVIGEKNEGPMAKDLREFLKRIEETLPRDFIKVDKVVDPANFDVAAVLQHLADRGEQPMVMFERPLNIKRDPSGIRILVNVFARRERCAVALDLDHGQPELPLSLGYSDLARQPIKPTVIPREDAPAKEIVRDMSEIDTRELPIVMHSEGDYGPCLTMALAVRDPVSGSYNASFIKAFYDFEDNRRLRITIHSPDSERALRYHEERDIPMPIVAVLGHHPAFYLATTSPTPYENDDYELIGGFMREPLRLAPSETWGDDFLVPADAEILIEGEVPPGVRMIADPFGDITRQYQSQTLRPVMEVKAITHRRDAIMQDVLAGHRDGMTVGGIPNEGTLYNNLKRRFGDLITAVHYPYSGCARLAVYVSIRKTKEGQAKSVALAAVQESRLCEMAVVVDDEIDVFNEADVIWAILVYADPSHDVDLIRNTMPNSFTTAMGYKKLVIDATRPLDRPMPEMNRIPAEALDRIVLDDYLNGDL